MNFIDTHIHIDGEEFDADREEVITRAREAGVVKMLVPAIDMPSTECIIALCQAHKDMLRPMIGLHPEEVRADWRNVLSDMRRRLDDFSGQWVAIGEVGLDYYWSREYEKEQLEAFEEQVKWSVETHLPLMIHCRKAQGELTGILRKYRKSLHGGVFHCFTGNAFEAAELLSFDGFMLGIGGVLTFKKSNLPEVLPSIPIERIVLETDAPYMAPVPMRGKRNESAYISYIISKISECYGISEDDVARITTANATKVFNL